jgi:hypothetical protein
MFSEGLGERTKNDVVHLAALNGQDLSSRNLPLIGEPRCLCNFELCLKFGFRCSRNAQDLPEFTTGQTALPLGDIAPDRHGGTLHLENNSVKLFARETLGQAVYLRRKLDRTLPGEEVTKGLQVA